MRTYRIELRVQLPLPKDFDVDTSNVETYVMQKIAGSKLDVSDICVSPIVKGRPKKSAHSNLKFMRKDVNVS